MLRTVFAAAGLAVFTGLLTGCGDGGFNLSGKVTFNGKPIPAGKIYFTPDSSQGNDGPTGYATIANGQYDTSAEGSKPVAGGPMIIGIEGFDPAAKVEAQRGDTSGEVIVKALFPYYETKKDLPKDSTTVDFDVPAEAALRKDQPEVPQIVP